MTDFRPVHRATPLLKFWTAILAFFAIAIANLNGSALLGISAFFTGEMQHLLWLLAAVAGFALLCAVVWWGSGLWWKAMGYRLDAEEVQVKHGVLSTNLRTARFDRIQAVDVVEPVIARIFRVAKVRIETAGGQGSALEILYLSKPEAERVRSEILSRISTTPLAEEPQAAEFIPTIPIQHSIIAAALHPATVLLLIALPLLVVPGAAGAALPLLAAAGPWLWNVVDSSWRFTGTLHDATLNVTYGLADKRKQTIPLGRIHGVKVVQPILWRRFGWWKVMISVAGYGAADKQSGTTTVLPVGSRELALKVAATLGPATGEELDGVVKPEAAERPQYRSPRRARWVSPIDWKQQAVTVLGERAVVIHAGRFSHRMSMVSFGHIQELSLVRGPIAQVLGIATLRLDMVPGPVMMSAQQLAVSDATELLDQLRLRKLPELYSSTT
ncbi:PH domain-containing protein [Corynebacterium hindlerae]|uniref:PH domain-containing protein n=1 Tax=Corynebacterium hindlerae TaxID=699041 RepID=UPI003AAE7314